MSCHKHEHVCTNTFLGFAIAYAPGLGEIMTLQQMRHTKLSLAGEAGNWDLAAYEIKELQEAAQR